MPVFSAAAAAASATIATTTSTVLERPFELFRTPCNLPRDTADHRLFCTIMLTRLYFNPFTGATGYCLRDIDSNNYRVRLAALVPKHSHMLDAPRKAAPASQPLAARRPPAPPQKQQGAAAAADDDDEIICNTTSISLQCSYIGSRLKKPMRLTLCGHLIDDEVAQRYSCVRWPSNWPQQYKDDPVSKIPLQPCCPECNAWIPWAEHAFDVELLLRQCPSATRLCRDFARNIWYDPDS
jgi:hypothetical protein